MPRPLSAYALPLLPDCARTTSDHWTLLSSQTPPGVTFPIMWVLVVGPLRAFSSTLVWEATGMHLLNPVLLCIMLHLSIGDVRCLHRAFACDLLWPWRRGPWAELSPPA